MKRILVGVFLISGMALFSGCKEDNSTQPVPVTKSIDQLTINSAFNFETTKNVSVTIKVQTPSADVMKGVPIKLYKDSPLSSGNYIETLASDDAGMISTSITLPGYTDSLYLVTDYIGLPSEIAVPITATGVEYVYNKLTTGGGFAKGGAFNQTQYKTLGTWNNAGVPNYLVTPRDVISQSLLNNINTSLPERSALPNHHPQYLAGVETNAILQDSAEVFVTFIHEGAGYKNVLGFYTYDRNSPPATIADIEQSMTIIFPNASYNGSGGGLSSGDKVKIGNFSANTVIGWFILSDGYDGLNVTNGKFRFFSNTNLNPETNTSLRQHNVLLYDAPSNRLILGFEDIKRDNAGCDNDFNDVLFYVSANPFSALVTNNVAPLDSAIDSDKDGVTDIFDEYKTDPLRAFNNYSPAKNVFGSLAFEDLWPARGDYDFNDLVVDYNYNLVANAKNKVVEMFAELKVRAVGGSFVNAFGFQLPVAASVVSSVTGQKLTEGYINLNANGTEAGNSKATIIAFDNPAKVINGGGVTINTTPGQPFYEPKTVSLKITFVSPVNKADLGTAPYNPFIIINKVRGKEVHLPGSSPTDLADTSFFGKDDDRTIISQGRYYKSIKNLPWAVNFAESFDYPVEKVQITSAYNYFAPWAESSAGIYKDWYGNKAGYRNAVNIFTP